MTETEAVILATDVDYAGKNSLWRSIFSTFFYVSRDISDIEYIYAKYLIFHTLQSEPL